MGALERERIRRLEAELDEALERCRQLEEAVMGTGWMCPSEFRLTPAEQRVLAALVAQERCTKEFLHLANTGPGRDCETEIKIVDVFICKMRKKLGAYDLQIETLWGTGYALRPADRDRLKHWPPNAPAPEAAEAEIAREAS